MKFSIGNSIINALSGVGCSLKKHSPTIFLVSGIFTGIACVGTAIYATTKAVPVVEEAKNDLETIKKTAADEERKEEYSEDDAKKDTVAVYTRAAKEMIKLYSIPLALGALSVFNVLASHKVMKERNAAITAAYVALDEGYKKYKARIVDKLGSEAERRIRYGLKAKEIEEEIVDENGEKKTVKTMVDVPDDSDPTVVITDEGVYTVEGTPEASPYARFFDMSSPYWDKDHQTNLCYLMNVENYFNQILKHRKQIFLNEAYRKLGIPEIREGQALGWKYDPKREGKKQISFGIHNICRPSNRDFVNGYKREVLLDFNVSVILDEVWPTVKGSTPVRRQIPVTP